MSNLADNANLDPTEEDAGSADYLVDFVRWTERQAQLLREGRMDALDIENLVEEIESMGRSDKRELRNRLAVLIAHLLKCKFQPQRKGESWFGTIFEQRRQIESIIEDSPSLKNEPQARLEKAYSSAVRQATKETGMARTDFPATNPFSLDEIFDEDFIP